MTSREDSAGGSEKEEMKFDRGLHALNRSVVERRASKSGSLWAAPRAPGELGARGKDSVKFIVER